MAKAGVSMLDFYRLEHGFTAICFFAGAPFFALSGLPPELLPSKPKSSSWPQTCGGAALLAAFLERLASKP